MRIFLAFAAALLLLVGVAASVQGSLDVGNPYYEIEEACPHEIPFYVQHGYPPKPRQLTLGPKWLEGEEFTLPNENSTWIEWATYYGKLIDAASRYVFELQDVMTRVVRTCYLVSEGGFTFDQAFTLLEIFEAIDYRNPPGEDRWGTKPWQ